MRSNYKKLGGYIRPVDERNSDLAITNLQGVSITKEFVPSIANIIGTDLSTYKIVRTGQFAYGPVTSRNGDKVSIALLKGEDCIISSSYSPFEVYKPDELLPEYLMLWFMRPEFDRYARFMSNGSAREVFDWDCMCGVELPVPSISEQRKIVRDYQVITDRIALLRKMNDKLVEAGTFLFRSAVDGIKGQYSETALYDIAGYINGTSFSEEEYADSGLPIIKIAELKDGITAATQYFVGDKEEKYFVEDGDVLFSWSGNPETSIDAFIWSHRNGILNQHTFKMVCSHGKAFTFFMLKYCKPDFVKAAQGKQTTGLGHVTVQDLKRLTIPFDADKAKEFNDTGMPIFDSVFRNLKEINLLNKMKEQRLISLSRPKGA